MSVLTSIGGDLLIQSNDNLASLIGLENITTVGGNLTINYNDVLPVLTGLEGLTSVLGDLIISGYNITSLTGLESMTAVGGNLKILGNTLLISMAGLDNLTFIGGNFIIDHNPALTSILELNNVSYVGGGLYFQNNDLLTSLAGLEGLNSVGDLSLVYLPLTDLTGLENLTSVRWRLLIYLCNALESLNGLNNLDSIGVELQLGGNSSLTSLAALNNLTYIGDLIHISGTALTNLTGLNRVTYIGGSLNIGSNPEMTSLTGLDSLNSVGSMRISQNSALLSLEGLESVTSVVEDVTIFYNDSLLDLTGLEGLTSVGGRLIINTNNALSSLTGLDALTTIEGNIKINDSPALISMAGLESLNSIGDSLFLKNNTALTSLAGLDNLTSIGGGLCLEANNNLNTLSALGNLTFIGGDLKINSTYALTNLSGLNNVNYIGGNIDLELNNALVSLAGLDDVDSIGGLYIGSHINLISLAGLNNLIDINGNVEIHDNPLLPAFTTLNSLNSIGGDLKIYNNPMITSLAGLDNIDAGSISNLSIHDNINLATCAVQSVCFYLAAPNGTVEIYSNAAGCNSEEEVESICGEAYPLNLSVYAQEDTVCINDSVLLSSTVIGNIGECSFLWTSQPAGFYSTLQNPNAFPDQPTLYRLSVTAGYQTAEDSVWIYTFPLSLSVYSLEDSVCAYDAVNLYSTVSCDSVDYNFSWTSQPPGFYSNLQNPVAFPEQSTLYILSVSATYQTAEDSVWIYIYPYPTQFSLLNGGFICDGSSGLELGLDGSELNNDYELLRNSNITGITVPGTGFPISFGFQNIEGNYAVGATNGVTGCQGQMANTADIYYFNYNSTDQICLVNVDSSTMKNMIMWDKTPDDAIASYNIYRESTSGGSFEMMGNVSHTIMSVYLDNTSSPLQRSFTYGITTLDTCNNESSMSAVHTTMHLNINTGINSYNLIWTPYHGFDYQTYYIYRRQAPEGFQIIDSVPNSITSYTDLNPPAGILDFVIEIRNENGCNPQKDNKSYISVFSNIISTNVGIEDLEKWSGIISVFPNPTREVLNIEIGGISGEFEADIYIHDINGQKLISKYITTAKTSIEIKDLRPGVYILQIKQGNTVITRRMVVI
ncbi:MAG: T9SS type A sorting domain-containing protein [Bacteroidales bacterium]|nr:T9SS type A sorting domain-containing protein [Bacteroidales bacterium]